MAVATRTQSPRSRALSAALRKAREDTGMSSRELAARLSLDQSHLSRIETGKRTPNIETTAMILAVLRTTRDERERILDLARNAGEPNWLTAGAPVSQTLAGICECERAASRVTAWHPSLVPGLLQTTSYARSLVAPSASIDGIPESEVEFRVGVRESRRAILHGPDPLPLIALISAGVLRNPLGTPAIMVGQLVHLLCMSERSAVSLRVVPEHIGWHPGLLGPFVLYGFPDSLPVVYLEHHSSSAFDQDEYDVRLYRNAIGELMRIALDEDDSRALISRMKDEWSAQCGSCDG